MTPTKNSKAASLDVSDADELLPLPTDTARPIRLGLWVLVLGFGSFLAWAAWAPLDEGVAAQATVAIEAKRRTIQHLGGGVVRKLEVKEGQVVQEGDLLVELEDGNARANQSSMRQTYLAQRAAESRLTAELSGQGAITWHPDLLAEQTDPLVQQHLSTQAQLFAARRATLKAELAGLQDSVAGIRAQMVGLASMLDSRKAQSGLQAEQLKSLKGLAEQGYAPRNQVLQIEQGQAELAATMADLQANRRRAEQQIAELTERMAQRRSEYLRESSAALAEVRREVQSGQDKLKALSDELKRVAVRAPVAGQVVGLAAGALGAVVTPGQRLMDIVPKGAPLLVDVRIPPHVIDRVKVGSATEVRFSAFANSPQLVIDGRLVSLSEDALSEQMGQGTVTYYLGRVALTPEGQKALEGRVMQPGMPAEVLIKTGERSLLTYLLHPLTRRLASAMKEE